MAQPASTQVPATVRGLPLTSLPPPRRSDSSSSSSSTTGGRDTQQRRKSQRREPEPPEQRPPVARSRQVPEAQDDERLDKTALRQHMRALLLDNAFKGQMAKTLEERQQKLGLSMDQRMELHKQGRMPREEVWALKPIQPARPKTSAHWETPPMLDAACLIVRAVHAAAPPALTEWLAKGLNKRTTTGGFRPWLRYLTQHERKHYVCLTFRQFHEKPRAGRTNREAWEPMREYLPLNLVVMAIRLLLTEIRESQHDFCKFPIADVGLTADDYTSWEHYALRGVQEMLEEEKSLLKASDRRLARRR